MGKDGREEKQIKVPGEFEAGSSSSDAYVISGGRWCSSEPSIRAGTSSTAKTSVGEEDEEEQEEE